MDKNKKKKHKFRLRQRFLRNGLEGFHNYEVLELLLSYTIIRKDTKLIAKKLLDKFGTVTEVINAPQELLLEVKGLGERSVTLLKLFKSFNNYHLKERILDSNYISCSNHVFTYLKHYFKGLKTEQFKVLYLNNKNNIIYEETLAKGTTNEAKIYIKTLMEKIILLKASAIIIAHNHPTGSLEPSKPDINLTKRLEKALKYIEIRLLDHLIIGDNEYFSFKDNNLF